MNRTKLTITIDTENELTEEEIVKTMIDFKYRLVGYHTDGLKFLENADINIDKKYFVTMLP
jgi:hypothetical protein